MLSLKAAFNTSRTAATLLADVSFVLYLRLFQPLNAVHRRQRERALCEASRKSQRMTPQLRMDQHAQLRMDQHNDRRTS